MKVTVVGAGSVGSSCAEYLAIKDIADDIVLLDIKEGFAEGKSLDLIQTSSSLDLMPKSLVLLLIMKKLNPVMLL